MEGGAPICALLFGLGHIIAIFIAIFWVYGDAEHHGQSGCLFALLVFFLGLPGLLVWLVIRNQNNTHREYTPTRARVPQPAEPPGKLFNRVLTANYLLWKQEHIDLAEFKRRKEEAILGLRSLSGNQRPDDFFAEVVSYIENGILDKADIAMVERQLAGSKSGTGTGSGGATGKSDQQLIKDYLRNRHAELGEELSQRGYPLAPVELVTKLTPTNLIDLYREKKELLYSEELRRRGLDNFI